MSEPSSKESVKTAMTYICGGKYKIRKNKFNWRPRTWLPQQQHKNTNIATFLIVNSFYKLKQSVIMRMRCVPGIPYVAVNVVIVSCTRSVPSVVSSKRSTRHGQCSLQCCSNCMLTFVFVLQLSSSMHAKPESLWITVTPDWDYFRV